MISILYILRAKVSEKEPNSNKTKRIGDAVSLCAGAHRESGPCLLLWSGSVSKKHVPLRSVAEMDIRTAAWEFVFENSGNHTVLEVDTLESATRISAFRKLIDDVFNRRGDVRKLPTEQRIREALCSKRPKTQSKPVVTALRKADSPDRRSLMGFTPINTLANTKPKATTTYGRHQRRRMEKSQTAPRAAAATATAAVFVSDTAIEDDSRNVQQHFTESSATPADSRAPQWTNPTRHNTIRHTADQHFSKRHTCNGR